MLTSISKKQNYTRKLKASSHLIQIQALNMTNKENLHDNNKFLSVCPIMGIHSVMIDGTDRDRKTKAKIYTRARISSKPARYEYIDIHDINMFASRKRQAGSSH